MPLVVSDASPLIALNQIGRLELLHQLFGEILVPPIVVEEVRPSLDLPEWFVEKAPGEEVAPKILGASLDPGESQAITLALELGVRRLILDERAARRIALSLGLPVVGTLGILIAAKKRGLISAMKTCLEELEAHDFRMSEQLLKKVLSAAGEAT